MRRDLDHVIAGVGARTRKTGGEDVVDRLAGTGVRESRTKHGTRSLGVEGLETARGEGKSLAAGETNQRERGAAGWRRQRDDRIGKQLGLDRRWNPAAGNGRFAQPALGDHVLLRKTEEILSRIIQIEA